jgi:hypothetical protein
MVTFKYSRHMFNIFSRAITSQFNKSILTYTFFDPAGGLFVGIKGLYDSIRKLKAMLIYRTIKLI